MAHHLKTKGKQLPVQSPPVARTRYEEDFGMDLAASHGGQAFGNSGVVTYRFGRPTDSALTRQRQASRRRANGDAAGEQRVVLSTRVGLSGAVVTVRLPQSGYRTVYVCSQGTHECWFDQHSGPAAARSAHARVLRWLQPLRQAHTANALYTVRAIVAKQMDGMKTS